MVFCAQFDRLKMGLTVPNYADNTEIQQCCFLSLNFNDLAFLGLKIKKPHKTALKPHAVFLFVKMLKIRT